MLSIATPLIDGFMAGAAPLIIKAVYDKVIGNAPADLRRRIDDLSKEVAVLTGKNQELISENASKQQTITVLTGVVEAERRDKAALMDQLAEAAKERKAALGIKNGEIRRIQTDERNCKKESARLAIRVTELEQQLGPTMIAARFANDRAEALETGVEIGDITSRLSVVPHR